MKFNYCNFFQKKGDILLNLHLKIILEIKRTKQKEIEIRWKSMINMRETFKLMLKVWETKTRRTLLYRRTENSKSTEISQRNSNLMISLQWGTWARTLTTNPIWLIRIKEQNIIHLPWFDEVAAINRKP